VHVPEAALRSGGLGHFGCELRVRVNLAHWEVAKSERGEPQTYRDKDGCQIRLATKFGQDALLGGCVVQDGWPASMLWLECREPLTIEQTHQGCYGVTRPPTSPKSSLDVRVAISYGEQDLRARDERGWQAQRPTDTLQVRPLLWPQRSERILLNTRHGHLQRRAKPANTPVLAPA
jgi:hypothetical protein